MCIEKEIKRKMALLEDKIAEIDVILENNELLTEDEFEFYLNHKEELEMEYARLECDLENEVI